MPDQSTLTTALIGTFITAILLLIPFPYQYAPIAGGVSAGIMAGHYRQNGARIGVLIGLGMLPTGTLIVLLLTGAPSLFEGSGGTVLIQSLYIGDVNGPLFLSVLVYFLAVYTLLCATLSAVTVSFSYRTLPQKIQ